MARILYVFPHPDDESFGPAPALVRQRREGHEVYLLTLSRGENTRQRARFGYSKAEMGEVRYREMQCVARTLDLTDLTVLDFPDGGFDRTDPLEIEQAVATHVGRVRPDVVATYVTHGISGHPDHLVGHAAVKRVYCDYRRRGVAYPRRLALFTLPEPGEEGRPPHLRGSPAEDIGCIVPVGAEDLQTAEAALDCYETYQAVIEAHRPLEQVRQGVCFALFQERHQPPLTDLFDRLPPA